MPNQNSLKKIQYNMNITPRNSLKNVLAAQNKNTKITLKNNDGNLIENSKDKANEMNNFFTSIGPNLAKNMRDPWVYSGVEVADNIRDINTNSEEILKYLKEINLTKFSAIPLLSTKILKPALILLCDKLAFIYNLCFQNRCFPKSWKTAIGTPLPKDGDLSLCTNYRPISQLPLSGKILEQIIHNRIDTFCSNNHILWVYKGYLGRALH